ncbi:MAG: pseudouridine synthase [Micrococcus sp.]|nr:pseudouridine synthase [Micrococcus sp.]
MAVRPPLPVRNGVNPTRLRVPASGPWASVQDYLLDRFGHVDPDGIRRRFRDSEIVGAEGQPVPAETALGVHEFLWYYRDLPHEPALPVQYTVLHRDERLVVIDKPHFLPVTPGGRFIQETALVRLRRELGIDDLVPLHRLDRATAGVVMFSCDPATRGAYHLLFERRAAQKSYEAVSALPVPHPPGSADDDVGALTERFPLVVRSRIRKDKGILRSVVEEIPVRASGRRAGDPVRTRHANRPHVGANAETRIELLGVGPSPGTLAGQSVAHWRLSPRTGRTHQLRLHLASLGLGIAFDPFYPDLLDVAPDDFSRPLQLLARRLSFIDPVTGEPREFVSRARLQEAPRQNVSA